MTCVVLAGGKSKRLGRDKMREIVGKEAVIQRVVRQVSPLSSEVLLVTAPGQSFPPGLPGKVVYDIYPGAGSLGGLYTGLVYAASFHSLVVASDMPFLNKALLQRLLELAPGYDVVIPRWNGYLEALHAVYSKDCLGPIERLIARGELKILEFFPLVKVRYLEEDEINRLDPKRLSFFNINTQEDLERARTLALEESIPA